MVKKWFQAYLGLGVPQVEKYNGYIHVFMSSQANDSSADFSDCICKPEAEIHQNRK